MLRVRCRATGANPMREKRSCSARGCGCAYSTNSNPSVPIGLPDVIWAGGASNGNGPMAILLFVRESRRISATSVQNRPGAECPCTDRVYCGPLMQTIELDEFDFRLLGAL